MDTFNGREIKNENGEDSELEELSDELDSLRRDELYVKFVDSIVTGGKRKNGEGCNASISGSDTDFESSSAEGEEDLQSADDESTDDEVSSNETSEAEDESFIDATNNNSNATKSDVSIPKDLLIEASKRFPPFWRTKHQLANVEDDNTYRSDQDEDFHPPTGSADDDVEEEEEKLEKEGDEKEGSGVEGRQSNGEKDVYMKYREDSLTTTSDSSDDSMSCDNLVDDSLMESIAASSGGVNKQSSDVEVTQNLNQIHIYSESDYVLQSNEDHGGITIEGGNDNAPNEMTVLKDKTNWCISSYDFEQNCASDEDETFNLESFKNAGGVVPPDEKLSESGSSDDESMKSFSEDNDDENSLPEKKLTYDIKTRSSKIGVKSTITSSAGENVAHCT